MKKIEFETFRQFGNRSINNMTEILPSCFNDEVRVKKVRVTIEDIEEPLDVYKERLKSLYATSKNLHHKKCLRIYAKKFGIDIQEDV